MGVAIFFLLYLIALIQRALYTEQSRKYSNFNPKILGFFKVNLMVILLSAQLKTKV